MLCARYDAPAAVQSHVQTQKLMNAPLFGEGETAQAHNMVAE